MPVVRNAFAGIRVCVCALILNAGRLMADGTPDGLTAAQPGAKTFTQAFVRMAAATAAPPPWADHGRSP